MIRHLSFYKKNYYRLELGQLGYSEVISIKFIDFANGYQVIPNPIIDRAIVYFTNTGSHEMVFKLYDGQGNLKEVISTTDNFIEVNRNGLIPGIYFFSIEGNSTKNCYGRFAVF